MVLIGEFHLIPSQHILLLFLINMELNIDHREANPETTGQGWWSVRG